MVKKMNEKTFLITLDTEEDNQWNPNQPPTTENAKYLPRFQELCEKYGFKPTWLTTYKMASDPFFVEYFRDKQNKGLCEIGMHLYAWNTPPNFKLPTKTNERSYLIEYPEDIMDAKIATITEFMTNKFDCKIKVILDKKWRNLSDDSSINFGISQSDIYQMYAYSRK